MSLFRAAATVGGLTLVSRALGFVRDVLIALALGAGPVADAFFLAFRLPNFLRRLFAEGAFNAAFVPLFARKLAQGAAEAQRFAESVQAVLIAALLLVVLAGELAMPWIVAAVASGWAGLPQLVLTVEFARITFPYILFISLVSLYGGVLNTHGRFAATALAPALLNLCLIGALLGLDRVLPTPGHALAWGVAAAGIAQFLWLAHALARAGGALALPWPRLSPDLRRLLMLMLPAAVGSSIGQVSLLLDALFASFLPSGSLSFLYYADRIYELPLAVIGIAIGTAILPLLARQLRAGEERAAAATLERALALALFFTLPAAAALAVLAQPIIAVLFERGAFGPAETHATAAALSAYAFGLPAFVLVKILAPAFFAREDTATPVRIALASLAVNVAAALALMGPLRHVGLALATSIGAWVNALALGWTLRRRGQWTGGGALASRALRTLGASAVMAGTLIGLVRQLADWLAGPAGWRAAALAVLVAAGLSVFAAAALALRAADPRELRRASRRGD